MKVCKTIRDPIHGNIELNELEVKLIDTPQLQRLRRIRQNGFCYLVYPSMNSTRFEHSLGVLYLADVVADHLDVGNHERETLRVAGLLHDVGHAAFSHTTDDILMSFGCTHEENAIHIILKTEISKILKTNGIKPKEVVDLITGKGALGKIISSEIDVDRMDYLIRDSHYAGVAYGVIDLERIIESMRIVDDELVVVKDGLEAVESLLINRNMMYQTVYRHHTKRIAETMFKQALAVLLKNKKITYKKLMSMDDADLINRLRNSSGYTKEMMVRLDSRKLFKIAFQEKIGLIAKMFRDDLIKNQERIQNRIATELGIRKGFVLLDMPEMKLSEFKIRIQDRKELKLIDEISSLARSLEKSEREKLMFCIYTAPEYLKKFKKLNLEKYIQFSQTKLGKFV